MELFRFFSSIGFPKIIRNYVALTVGVANHPIRKWTTSTGQTLFAFLLVDG
jgi:hypothetical protein